jgi:hypothetical protein
MPQTETIWSHYASAAFAIPPRNAPRSKGLIVLLLFHRILEGLDQLGPSNAPETRRIVTQETKARFALLGSRGPTLEYILAAWVFDHWVHIFSKDFLAELASGIIRRWPSPPGTASTKMLLPQEVLLGAQVLGKVAWETNKRGTWQNWNSGKLLWNPSTCPIVSMTSEEPETLNLNLTGHLC